MPLLLFLLITSLALKAFQSTDLGWIAEQYRAQWSYAKKLFANYLFLLSTSGMLVLYILRSLALDENFAHLYTGFGMFIIIAVIEHKTKRKVQ